MDSKFVLCFPFLFLWSIREFSQLETEHWQGGPLPWGDTDNPLYEMLGWSVFLVGSEWNWGQIWCQGKVFPRTRLQVGKEGEESCIVQQNGFWFLFWNNLSICCLVSWLPLRSPWALMTRWFSAYGTNSVVSQGLKCFGLTEMCRLGRDYLGQTEWAGIYTRSDKLI